ncbi:MAG: hypothetical protein HXX11_10860 [Desulfuromonadales bacterium]|nr:hypothetical protein [Desulfuromonadales bacterium]
MRKIKTEIEQCLSALEKNGPTLTSHFMFPPEFIGFQGHFPQQKVLPGACQIQCVLTTIEKWFGRGVALHEIVLVKFVAPVLPDQEICCTVSECEDTNGEWICRARISRDENRVTEMKLRLSLKGQCGVPQS